MIQLTRPFIKSLLSGALAAASTSAPAGALSGVKIALFTNAPVLSVNSVFTDLTEPTYPGYSELTITWGAPADRADGSYAVVSQVLQFQMSDSTTPTTILGYAVIQPGTTPTLLFAENLPTPISLATPDDACKLIVEYAYGSSDNGSVTQLT